MPDRAYYAEYELRIIMLELRSLIVEYRELFDEQELRGWITKNGRHILIGEDSGGGKSGKKVDKSRGSSIIKSGAISGALSPDSKEAQKHADQYYQSVRKMTNDINRISDNTGFSKSDIEQIKNHVFIQEHDLGNGVPERFYPSYAMAQSWQRLIDGKNIQKHDITLLNHEKMESNLMKNGFPQEAAHRETEKIYNYAKESREYYAELNKHNKKQQ